MSLSRMANGIGRHEPPLSHVFLPCPPTALSGIGRETVVLPHRSRDIETLQCTVRTPLPHPPWGCWRTAPRWGPPGGVRVMWTRQQLGSLGGYVGVGGAGAAVESPPRRQQHAIRRLRELAGAEVGHHQPPTDLNTICSNTPRLRLAHVHRPRHCFACALRQCAQHVTSRHGRMSRMSPWRIRIGAACRQGIARTPA